MPSKLNEAWKEAYVDHYEWQTKASLDLMKVPVDIFQAIFHVSLATWVGRKILKISEQQLEPSLVILGVIVAGLAFWLLIRLINVVNSLFYLAYSRLMPGSVHQSKILSAIVGIFSTMFVVALQMAVFTGDRVFF